MKPQKIKETLLKACQDYVQNRRGKVLSAITSIEESLFEEGKSTAGDKHHTGRAMLQIDRENAGKQLQEVEKLEAITVKLSVEIRGSAVRLGSLVITDRHNYFLGISAGMVQVDGVCYYCVSGLSPIGKLLLGKLEKEVIVFNGVKQEIMQIH